MVSGQNRCAVRVRGEEGAGGWGVGGGAGRFGGVGWGAERGGVGVGVTLFIGMVW